MNGMGFQGQLAEQGGQPGSVLPKFDRTVFDYIIIALGYLLMPIGLVLALLRLLSSHYKNYRKGSNFNLLFHVFVGGFVEIVVLFMAEWINGKNSIGTTIIIFVMFALMLLLPAFIFGNLAAKGRYRFIQLTTVYLDLIVSKGITYIGSLSEISDQSESDVRRDILYLKDRGILEPHIIFNEGRQMEPIRTSSGFGSTPSQPQTQSQLPKSIRCSGCGAQNTVNPSQSKSCDYCGTTIAYF
ncbi:hypothetical protein [Paenibacillus wynnii]|uniref:Uncharacterized protein n=1 Tax=Paenibacillus wynnii TaxID=268407 RepID=A0A098M9R6_9BACL|nr:hypothetical protein [Paenibacillus wynnii]KGE18282.1 hypothetical protein PWYN_27585 [Paenibacillus wynnii]